MICHNCGESLREGSKFCGSCGTTLTGALPAQPRGGYPNQPPAAWPVDHRSQPNDSSGYTPSFMYGSASQASGPPPRENYYSQANGPNASGVGKLSKAGKIMGIIVGCIMVCGLIPCLGWLNWFTLLFGIVTKVLCWVAVFTEGRQDATARTNAIIGLVIATAAVFIGAIRLILGGGCL